MSAKDEDKREKTCFIITPIGGRGTETFRKTTGVIDSVIRPILIDEGFCEVKAAHEICESGSINTQVINKIIESDLVVANLTNNNPNVMYELCLRHVVAKPIIHICEMGTTLPFDIKDNRTIFYTDDMMGVRELQKELSKFIKLIDYKKEYNDNPVYTAIQIGNLLKIHDSHDMKNAEYVLLQKIFDKVSGGLEITNERIDKLSIDRTSKYRENDFVVIINNVKKTDTDEFCNALDYEMIKLNVKLVNYDESKRSYRIMGAVANERVWETINEVAKWFEADIAILDSNLLTSL